MFIVAVLHSVSLTPLFSEVHGRVSYHNRFSGLFTDKKTAEAVGDSSGAANTQLKQSVNERV